VLAALICPLLLLVLAAFVSPFLRGVVVSFGVSVVFCVVLCGGACYYKLQKTSSTLELVLETSSTMELVNNVMELVNNFFELVNNGFPV
jgi:CHASE3 domain sensor protein